jgi:hypothetical protein
VVGVVHEFWFENGAFKIEMKRQLAIAIRALVTESHEPWVVTLHRMFLNELVEKQC